MKKTEQNILTSSTRKWGVTNKKAWFEKQTKQRSYESDVLAKLNSTLSLLNDYIFSELYGELIYGDVRYPLIVVKNRQWDSKKETVLITGGVHGYETSGVLGALKFIETTMLTYIEKFNIIVAPCVSPWGYETINRWNPETIDPNRSFIKDSGSAEAQLLMKYITSLNPVIKMHIDLHETTDTDNSIFRVALSQRDGIEQACWDIPDGFYLVGDSENPEHDFQTAIIEGVSSITHIAPADQAGFIIGEPTTQTGVINYDYKKLGLCAGFSQAQYRTTTEVYPDSLLTSPEICIEAQLSAITAGLDYLLNTSK